MESLSHHLTARNAWTGSLRERQGEVPFTSILTSAIDQYRSYRKRNEARKQPCSCLSGQAIPEGKPPGYEVTQKQKPY
jgi:hypothetical protein